MTAPIVVATDFSTRSDRAVRRAMMLAKQCDAELMLVHVVDDDQPAYLVDAQIAAARALLDEIAETLRQIDGVAARTKVASGDAFVGILTAADEVNGRLIVMGPHRRLLRNAFAGTTVERTIARSRRPVLMAAGVPSAPYDRVLIAVDLDDASRSAAEQVRGLGLLQGTDVAVMHAFDAPAEGMMKRAMSEPEAIDHYVAGEERRADARFEAFLGEVGLGAARQLLVPINGTAARTILECARAENAALIVVGTRQRSGLKRFLLGNSAEEILADADRDTLIIPQP